MLHPRRHDEAIFLGSGTVFFKFNYAGEARIFFRNSIIETVVLRVAG